MNLSTLLKITAISVVDVLVIFWLIPLLANSYGFFGIVAIPFLIVVAGVATVKIFKKILSNS
jgi:hypothetical protein